MRDIDTKTRVRPKVEVKPKTVLKAVFRTSEDQAYRIMITAHRKGVCVVAVFTKDVAETKATEAIDKGKAAGYPLMFTTEPEE